MNKENIYANTLFGFIGLIKMPNTTVNYMYQKSTSLTHKTKIGNIKINWEWNDAYGRYIITFGTVELNGEIIDVEKLPEIDTFKKERWTTSREMQNYILSIQP